MKGPGTGYAPLGTISNRAAETLLTLYALHGHLVHRCRPRMDIRWQKGSKLPDARPDPGDQGKT